jgi:hypothetical protein
MNTIQKWNIPAQTAGSIAALGYLFVFSHIHSLYVPGMVLLWPGVVLDVLLSSNLKGGFRDWRDMFFIVIGTWSFWTLLAFLVCRTRWGFPLAGLLAVFGIITTVFGMLSLGATLGTIGIGFAVGGYAYRSDRGKTQEDKANITDGIHQPADESSKPSR